MPLAKKLNKSWKYFKKSFQVSTDELPMADWKDSHKNRVIKPTARSMPALPGISLQITSDEYEEFNYKKKKVERDQQRMAERAENWYKDATFWKEQAADYKNKYESAVKYKTKLDDLTKSTKATANEYKKTLANRDKVNQELKSQNVELMTNVETLTKERDDAIRDKVDIKTFVASK